MGISDCRRKGTGIKQIHEDYVLIWSGVNLTTRATHGVGFILHPGTAKNVLETDFVSERIIKIRVRGERKASNFIQVYAPCNDSYSEEEKEEFFEKMADTINTVPDKEELIVMGDFNGRVGKRRTPWEQHLGPHSDTNKECNYNGEQLLALCAEYGLWITNTFYQHRPSQKQTWYRWNDLNVSSQIDFILTRIEERSRVTDARSIPNAALDTDHRPVILFTKQQRERTKKRKRKVTDRQINLRKLQEEEVRQEVETEVTTKLEEVNNTDMTAEEAWSVFKNTLTETLSRACGTKSNGRGQVKQTAWWNDTVKEAIKEKKKSYKVWVKSRLDEDYVKYRLARRHSKRIVRSAKELSWKEYGEELSQSIKAMRIRDEPYSPTTVISDKNGNPLSEEDSIKNRWQEYFRDLLNPGSQGNTQHLFQPRYPDEEEPNVLPSEVQQALKTSPKNKAAGIDGITTEAILACGEIGITWLTTIFQKAWTERKVPEDWQRAVVVPIWKRKGSKKDCSTYRGISLLSHTGKMYAKILEQRTRYKVEPLLSEAQMGFRKGRGCTDAIFALRQLSEKTIEHNKELNLVFIWFDVSSGVRQGCVLSPLLFIIYMDRITKEANPNPEDLNEMLFADDQSLAHETEEQLQVHTDRLNTRCEELNMKISISKTESMKVSRTPGNLNISIDGTPLKQVSEFKYLGSIFSADGRLNREIETRVQKANSVTYQLAPLLKHPYIPTETKARLIDSIFIPTLTYQCQTWTLTKSLERKITTCEMRCLRRAVNKTRRDMIRNTRIREMVGTTPVLHYIQRQTIRWFGHLTRMAPHQLASKAYNKRTAGYKARGRPRKTWIEGVKETLSSHNIPTSQAVRLARDRKLFLPSTP